MGFLGIFFVIGIFGGLVWLIMLIFGMGPYAAEVLDMTPTVTGTQPSSFSPSLTMTETKIPTRIPTQTLTPTVTPSPTLELLPFTLFGEPETWNSALIRPQLSCDWLVIAGQVWDLQDAPVTRSTTLHLYGELAGFTIDQFRLSGSATAYGESGYEFALEGLLVDSEDSLYIQLEDTNSLPLSHPFAVQTFNDCQQNLILINFKQVR